jgi:SnoaL-like protein
MDENEFRASLARLATAWNTGHPAAAECFTLNAAYLEPPDRQSYHGREELFEFFGGRATVPPAMSMTWHHIAFYENEQTGFGEYTFIGNNAFHGVAVIGVRDGLIDRWREYQYRSDLPWEEFAGH